MVSTSSTRCCGTAAMWAATARVLRPLRPGCIAEASSSVPTTRDGLGNRDERHAGDGGVAVVGSGEPGDHPQRGRLAGAVGAEEAGHRPAVAGEGDVVDDGNVAVTFGQGFSSNHAASVVAAVEYAHRPQDVIRAAIETLRSLRRPDFRRCRRRLSLQRRRGEQRRSSVSRPGGRT